MPGVGRTDRGAQRVTQSSVVLALQLLAVPILGAPVPDQDASAIEVRAIDALGEPTRRYRVSFRFRIVALTHVAAAQNTWAVGQVVGFTMYQGADWDSKARKGAIERLFQLLRATRDSTSTHPRLEATYSFGETRPLRLEVQLGVWTLTSADGTSVSVNTKKSAR